MVASFLEYASLAVAYSLLAAAVLETLLRLWRIREPSLALELRLLVLALPPLAPIIFPLISPDWGSEQFRRWALLDLHHWLPADPSRPTPGWPLLPALLGGTLLLFIGLEASGYLRRQRPAHGAPAPIPLPPEIASRLKGLACRAGCSFPILLVDHPRPSACTVGLLRPTILLTTGLLRVLDPEELEAVVAHEIAHGRRRDNWLGWLLLALRLASLYNPVALFAFHQIGQDMERICDAEAARLSGSHLALASALLKVHAATRRPARHGIPGWPGRLGRKAMALEDRARDALVEDRARRLLDGSSHAGTSYPALRLALAAGAVVGLAYMVA